MYTSEQTFSSDTMDLHEVAGLLSAGLDEDGDMEWIGSAKAWQRYEELVNEEGETEAKENLKTLLEKHFKIGTVVADNYGLDKVLDFEWNNGDWRVKVQAVKIDGSVDSRWPFPRMHCTEPNGLR